MQFYANLKGHTLDFLDKKTVKDWLESQKDGEYIVDIKRYFNKRTLNQNRYYWGVIIKELSIYTGFESEEVHEILKQRFLPKKFKVIENKRGEKKEFEIQGSTTDLSTVEFIEYNDKIIRWAAQHFGIMLPDPNQY